MSLASASAELACVLRAENAALEAMDLVAAGGLLAAKHAAAEALAQAWRQSDAEPAAAVTLRELGKLAAENKRLLSRAMRVQTRVLELVARAARTAQPRNCYGAAGRISTRNVTPHSLKTRI